MSTLASGTFGHRNTLPPAVHSVLKTSRAVAASVWQAMEIVGQRRAKAHLLSLASQKEAYDPVLAAALRRAADQGLMG